MISTTWAVIIALLLAVAIAIIPIAALREMRREVREMESVFPGAKKGEDD